MLQRNMTVPTVIKMVEEKLHLENSGKVHLLVEVSVLFLENFFLCCFIFFKKKVCDGLARRILGNDIQPSALVLKWRVGTSNRLLFLESHAATRLIQRDLAVMQVGGIEGCGCWWCLTVVLL
jgi:hypothetical protein